jgi:CRISPR-associated protein Cas2
MSTNAVKTWLVAYDIREDKRLRRVHRHLRREGASVQYSAFCVEADDRRIQVVLDGVRNLIASEVDDVRAYHIPQTCQVWQLGRQELPEGIQLAGGSAVSRLLSVATTGSGADADEHTTSYDDPGS